MVNERTSRAEDTRDKKSRAKMTFVPTGLLPEIEPDPDYIYRWVRISSRGMSDNPNVNARMREGWVPVKSEEMPGIQQYPDPQSSFPGMIEHGGLLLCKISKEIIVARNEYFAKKARQQIESVNNNLMRENDRRMPLFRESRSERKASA